MTVQKTPQSCFNCSRTEYEIPVVLWTYQERPLSVCSACIPLLIHKWEQVAATLNTQPVGGNNE